MNIANVYRQPPPPSSGGSTPASSANTQAVPVLDTPPKPPPQREPAVEAAAAASSQSRRIEAEAQQISKDAEQSRKSVEQLVERLSQQIRIENRSLSFRVDDNLGKTIVTVIDRDTEEVIRQIPSEDVIRLALAISEINEQRGAGGSVVDGTGLLIQEQA